MRVNILSLILKEHPIIITGIQQGFIKMNKKILLIPLLGLMTINQPIKAFNDQESRFIATAAICAGALALAGYGLYCVFSWSDQQVIDQAQKDYDAAALQMDNYISIINRETNHDKPSEYTIASLTSAMGSVATNHTQIAQHIQKFQNSLEISLKRIKKHSNALKSDGSSVKSLLIARMNSLKSASSLMLENLNSLQQFLNHNAPALELYRSINQKTATINSLSERIPTSLNFMLANNELMHILREFPTWQAYGFSALNEQQLQIIASLHREPFNTCQTCVENDLPKLSSTIDEIEQHYCKLSPLVELMPVGRDCPMHCVANIITTFKQFKIDALNYWIKLKTIYHNHGSYFAHYEQQKNLSAKHSSALQALSNIKYNNVPAEALKSVVPGLTSTDFPYLVFVQAIEQDARELVQGATCAQSYPSLIMQLTHSYLILMK